MQYLIFLFGGFLLLGMAYFAFKQESDIHATRITIQTDTEDIPLTVSVASTFIQRFRGLSGHDSLSDGSGMLFVHPFEKTHSYVMRGMDFPIDIIFIDSEGEITTIHEEVPPDTGLFESFDGYGSHVLEVPAGWVSENNVSVGDTAIIDLSPSQT